MLLLSPDSPTLVRLFPHLRDGGPVHLGPTVSVVDSVVYLLSICVDCKYCLPFGNHRTFEERKGVYSQSLVGLRTKCVFSV